MPMDERVGTTITDWARVATGFVVLGAQHAQVRGRELQKQLEPQLREAKTATAEALRAVRRLADQITER